MPYQVDVWGGDLYQKHAGSKRFEDWQSAADFMERLIDAGLLCNVLDTDFKAHPDKVAKAERRLAKTLQQ